MNMGYCRFQNTLSDFRDCKNNLYNIDSEEEKLAAKKLYSEARDYIKRYDKMMELDN